MKKFLIIFYWLPLHANLHIVKYQGDNVSAHIKTISSVCLQCFNDYPYYNSTPIELHMFYTQQYASTADSLICILFDDKQPVGIATGMPLAHFYTQPLLPHKEDAKTMYYLGELVIVKQYRHKGYGLKLYQAFEEQVKKIGTYKTICFCEIDKTTVAQEPADYKNLDIFWSNLGFVKSSSTCYMEWFNNRACKNIPHKMLFWFKTF